MGDIISFILIGFITGMIARIIRMIVRIILGARASKELNTLVDPSGLILATAIGVTGAFFATFIGQAIGWYGLDQSAGLIGATAGALLMLFIWNTVHPVRRPQKPKEQGENILADQQAVIIKNYTGSQAEATALFQADAIKMAERGYFPTLQSWAPGQWEARAFVGAVLLCLILVGILAIIYMLVVKPEGTLTVTYERRAVSLEEKTCPRCAERIKAAALVCHFCGHEFPPKE